ncbi:phytanoyl-CoA dioxygenase family protein [Burkholderia cenocepacia]|uniref:phytanoyl-CoA dioxygenase family protein n=1 Tax=Burkholderia cepacia complex TaxID=87882 RepID=UPI001F1A3BE0|nr:MULTISPECIES: phytanoyl-CoA dioxygenase family protein [Burkholderia cepacia complex]
MSTIDIHHEAELACAGWTVIPHAFDTALIDSLCSALGPSLALRDEIRQRNGVATDASGTLHHLLADDPCYIALLAAFESFTSLFHTYFGGKFVLNSYGGVINQRDTHAYVKNVHRDIRFGSEDRRFMLNALVMLDDFTLDNGATWLLSRSQAITEQPDDERFYAQASRATGKRSSLLLFDSRVWHAGGHNLTNAPRRALTLTFTSPFFKPQLDYPRLLGYRDLEQYSPWLRQVIGFNARVPESLDEFYVPVERRFYQRGQD